jgi:CRP-like cAMP-binding protein
MTTARSGPNGRNRLLAALLPADFALLASHLKDTHFEQGMVLQESGGQIEQVYFPHSGMISLVAVMQAGNGVESARIGREGAVGAMAGLGGRIAIARAVVQVEGTSSQISVSRFQTAVGESTGIRSLIERYNDVQMGSINQSVGCNALHHVETRLCRWLLQTRDRRRNRRQWAKRSQLGPLSWGPGRSSNHKWPALEKLVSEATTSR